MAQNDTHVALIILTSQMWGGGGLLVEKTVSGQNFVFLRLWRQHPFLHKTKGPTRNPISPTPPPSFGGRPCHLPAPPQSNFQVAKPWGGRPRFTTLHGLDQSPVTTESTRKEVELGCQKSQDMGKYNHNYN